MVNLTAERNAPRKGSSTISSKIEYFRSLRAETGSFIVQQHCEKPWHDCIAKVESIRSPHRKKSWRNLPPFNIKLLRSPESLRSLRSHRSIFITTFHCVTRQFISTYKKAPRLSYRDEEPLTLAVPLCLTGAYAPSPLIRCSPGKIRSDSVFLLTAEVPVPAYFIKLSALDFGGQLQREFEQILSTPVSSDPALW